MERFVEFFFNHWDLFLALLIILGVMVFSLFQSRLRGFKELEPSQAVLTMNREDALVLDVREDSEYRDGHITGSRHIPLGALGKRLNELDEFRDKPVIVGCRSGNRSGQACGLLTKSGFTNVYNLRGGMMAWQSAGLPVVKGGKSKKKG